MTHLVAYFLLRRLHPEQVSGECSGRCWGCSWPICSTCGEGGASLPTVGLGLRLEVWIAAGVPPMDPDKPARMPAFPGKARLFPDLTTRTERRGFVSPVVRLSQLGDRQAILDSSD